MVNTGACPFVIHDEVLSLILDEFYEKLLEDRYIKENFLSNENLNSIKAKQIQIIKELFKSFEDNNRKFKKLIKYLVEIHSKRGIPFELFINFVNTLKNIFIRYFGAKHFEIKLYIEVFFDEIENNAAKYYSKIIMREERKHILIEQSNLKEILDSEKYNMINVHINWLIGLNRAFSLEKEKYLPPLQEDSCCFFHEYIKNNKLCSVVSKKKNINRVLNWHKTLHESASLLRYLFFDKKDYRTFLYAFFKFSKEVYNFTNILLNIFIEEEKTTAKKDPLTSLYNRRSLRDVISYHKKLAKSLNTSFSIIMIDLDNFKKVNDIYGHIFGDKVLQHVSEIVRKNIRKNDYAFRYGGEEFLVLLPSADLNSAKKVAERIRKNLESSTVCYFGIKIRITASFGVAVFKDQYLDLDVEDMLKIVDKALYIAKKSGKNRVEAFINLP